MGAFLAAREESSSGAINSLYTLEAAPFSDAFLAMVAALFIALIAAFGLRGHIERSKSDHEYPQAGGVNRDLKDRGKDFVDG
jgi:DHA2 family metal-tetracycline-proton antiporter-like MFS transporter/DHA2 family florfenicol/chloramphenicol resistance protein-like MFS transporter